RTSVTHRLTAEGAEELAPRGVLGALFVIATRHQRAPWLGVEQATGDTRGHSGIDRFARSWPQASGGDASDGRKPAFAGLRPLSRAARPESCGAKGSVLDDAVDEVVTKPLASLQEEQLHEERQADDL